MPSAPKAKPLDAGDLGPSTEAGAPGASTDGVVGELAGWFWSANIGPP